VLAATIRITIPAAGEPRMPNPISWFEIPVLDFDRAKRFYETIFATAFTPMKVGEAGPQLAIFPGDPSQRVGGALACGSGYQPARAMPGTREVQEGVKVYLNAGEDLGLVLGRVEAAGGRVAVPKTQITPEFGFMGAFVDTEGNWVGLHSVR
jgi:predicted enzyme related to lactoylglutathione lyase